MKNIAIIIAVTVIIMGGIIWIARPDKSGGNVTAAVLTSLVPSETEYDFGSISMAKGDVSKTFTVKNVSAEPMLIEKIYTSCMCTSVSIIRSGQKTGPFDMPGHGFVPKVNQTLNPGESAEIEVVFDPKAHGPAGVGPIDRVVYIEEKDKLPLELRIKAVVTP